MRLNVWIIPIHIPSFVYAKTLHLCDDKFNSAIRFFYVTEQKILAKIIFRKKFYVKTFLRSCWTAGGSENDWQIGASSYLWSQFGFQWHVRVRFSIKLSNSTSFATVCNEIEVYYGVINRNIMRVSKQTMMNEWASVERYLLPNAGLHKISNYIFRAIFLKTYPKYQPKKVYNNYRVK